MRKILVVVALLALSMSLAVAYVSAQDGWTITGTGVTGDNITGFNLPNTGWKGTIPANSSCSGDIEVPLGSPLYDTLQNTGLLTHFDITVDAVFAPWGAFCKNDPSKVWVNQMITDTLRTGCGLNSGCAEVKFVEVMSGTWPVRVIRPQG